MPTKKDVYTGPEFFRGLRIELKSTQTGFYFSDNAIFSVESISNHLFSKSIQFTILMDHILDELEAFKNGERCRNLRHVSNQPFHRHL